MKLWLISQSQVDGYDTYDSAVVAAETEDGARRTDPGGYHEWDDKDGCWRYNYGKKEADDSSCWARDISAVKVELIGDAAPDVKAGVIVASFNAG